MSVFCGWGTKQTFVPMCLPGWLQLSARGLHNTGSHASTNERCVGPCQTYIISHVLIILICCFRALSQWSILVNGFFDGAWDDFPKHCSSLGDELATKDQDARWCIEINMESLIVVRGCPVYQLIICLFPCTTAGASMGEWTDPNG